MSKTAGSKFFHMPTLDLRSIENQSYILETFWFVEVFQRILHIVHMEVSLRFCKILPKIRPVYNIWTIGLKQCL